MVTQIPDDVQIGSIERNVLVPHSLYFFFSRISVFNRTTPLQLSMHVR